MTVLANPATIQVAVDHLARHDPILSGVIKAIQLPTITPHTNYYQELVDSIISQQLSVKAAATIQGRFNALFGSDTTPTPEQILTKDIEELRAVGLSRPKAGYIQDLAVKVLDESVQFGHLDKLQNEEIIAELTQIKGVGEWTVHMFLMFCMGRLDVLPVGDLGIKNGVRALYELDHAPTPDEIRSIATKNNWQPYETVASWYIWKSLDVVPSV